MGGGVSHDWTVLSHDYHVFYGQTNGRGRISQLALEIFRSVVMVQLMSDIPFSNVCLPGG